MKASCGNPTATAHLKPGEVVVDLGCGGGLDVLLAARMELLRNRRERLALRCPRRSRPPGVNA